MWPSSFFPRLVVIIITPFAPREPYKAPADASFSTVTDSISLGLSVFNAPSKGTPSITYKGVFAAEIDPKPRMIIEAPSPGCPLPDVLCTPATVPSKALETSATTRFSIRSCLTTSADPVNELFFAVP